MQQPIACTERIDDVSRSVRASPLPGSTVGTSAGKTAVTDITAYLRTVARQLTQTRPDPSIVSDGGMRFRS